MIKLTRMRNQPIASMLSGVATGAFAGFTGELCEPAPGVAFPTVVVAVAVTVGTLLLWTFALVVVVPLIRAISICASRPSITSVVAKSSGRSESAGVTRYQCPSHIAVITPPNASAAAKKLATTNAPPMPPAARGR